MTSMTLYGSTTSPYVRLCRLVIAHHGLEEAVTLQPIDTEAERAALREKNPLGKIPLLEIEGGEMIYDSPVICDYLDNLGQADSLFAHETLSPWRIRTLLALSNGILDNAVARTMMLKRTPDPEDQSQRWMDRWVENICVGLDAMAVCFAEAKDSGTIAELSFPVTLDYISFRLPELDWRAAQPEMAVWAEEALQLPRYVDTDPRG